MSLARYPEYKDSGVDWLGEIPCSWTVKPLKYSTHIYTGNSLNDAEKKLYESTAPDCLPYISSKDIDMETHEVQYENGLRIPTEQDELKVAPRGSFLLCIEGGSAGKKVAMLSQDVCFVNKLCCFSSEENSKFKYYFAQTRNFKDKFELSMTGLIGGVSTSYLKNFSIPTPSRHEQTAISNFLDRETGKIDALIAEQRRLVELLAEKRQALISHAVTKGLNSNTRMKDSGIEWLGEIPMHWRVERGRFLFQKLELLPESEDGVVTAFRDGQVTLRENRRVDGFTLAVLEVGYQRVRTGDLVIHGMDAFAGAIGVSESTGKCTPEYSVMTPLRPGIDNGYFALILRLMAQRNFIFVICPSVRERAPRFRFEAFKDVHLPVPPIDEQMEIMRLIESVNSEAKTLASEANRAIELLQERRSALISAAITGKIDTR